ncbi:MAG: ATP synthase F0 subunit B [Pseudomonadota bacterium]
MLLATEIELIPNWTLFIQIGIFLFVLFMLNFLFFKPLLKLMDRRKQFTSDASQEAASLNDESQQLEAGRLQVLGMALKEAQDDRAKRTTDAVREADKIINEGRAKMGEMISSNLISIESTENSIVDEMNDRATKLADEIIVRLKE